MSDQQLLQRGLRHYQAGELSDAEKCFRKVLARDNDNVHGLNLLGMLCINTGRCEEAVPLIRRALDLQPSDFRALGNLGLAYQRLGRLPDAEQFLRKSLDLNSDNPAILNSLGAVVAQMSRHAEAVSYYESALRLQGDIPHGWISLSQAQIELGRLEKAYQAAQQAVRFDPTLPEAQHQLGEVLRRKSQFDTALKAFRDALELDPGFEEAMLGLAATYRQMEQPEKALETLNQMITVFPNQPQGYSALGVLQEQMGNMEAAVKSFKKAIELAPEVITPYYQLAQIKGRTIADDELAAMERLSQREIYQKDEKAHLYFALADAYDQRNSTERAFDAWKIANSLRSSRFPYLGEKRASQSAAALQFSQRLLEKLVFDEAGSVTQKMVFVVGMPRSGTSLIDQVLTAHSRISSLGEVSYGEDLSRQVKTLASKAYPDGLPGLRTKDLEVMRRNYINRIPDTHAGSAIVLDKTPMNFQYLGLLASVFPEALFIHCYRDPIDNCFSIYKLPFASDQDYAHDLHALGHHYKLYWDMMRRWKALLPDRILDVCYENTVADLEFQAKRIAGFLGLEYERQMLEFYNVKRLVRTPSASQVRQPIYTKSVGAWRRYESYLQPLIDSLGNLVSVESN